jgi:hypothetical protein
MPTAAAAAAAKKKPVAKKKKKAAGKMKVITLVRFPSPSGIVGRPSRRQHIFGMI